MICRRSNGACHVVHYSILIKLRGGPATGHQSQCSNKNNLVHFSSPFFGSTFFIAASSPSVLVQFIPPQPLTRGAIILIGSNESRLKELPAHPAQPLAIF